MKTPTSKRRWFAGGALGVATLTLIAWAPSCKPSLAPNTVECPPFEDFKAVSPLLEARCGTLDCHGNVARPLRIYGQTGLRYNPDDDPDLYTGNPAAPTTDAEVERNYFSVCGIEPEKMAFVVAGEEPPETLTLVRKPRLSEKHKGGRIWNEGKVEDRCLVNWILSDYEEGSMPTQDCEDSLVQ
ncbi:MAG: hypothetical protein U0271_27525 [Polyangiaceae bacterium]